MKAYFCNTKNEWEGDPETDYVYTTLKGCRDVTVHPPCIYGSVYEYSSKAWQECDIGVIKLSAETDLSNNDVVIALNKTRKEKSIQIVPVYRTPAEYEQTRHMYSDHFRNDPVFIYDVNEETASFAFRLEQALHARCGQDISVQYPLGDASQGLVMNYFSIVSILLGPEFDEKYKSAFSEAQASLAQSQAQTTLEPVKKTVLIVPENCKCSFDLAAYGDEFKRENKSVLTLRKSEMHGLQRDVTLAVFKLQRGNKVYFVRVEMPNIITTLSKMTATGETDDFDIEGVTKLSVQQMHTQRDGFINRMKQLIDMRHSDEYLIVTFDGTKKTLASDILNAIEADASTAIEADASPMQDDVKDRKVSAVVFWDDQNDDQMKRVEEFTTKLQSNEVRIPEQSSPASRVTGDSSPGAQSLDFVDATAFFWILNGSLTSEQLLHKGEYLGHQDKNRFKQIVPILADDAERVRDSYFEGITCYRYCDAGTKGHESFIQNAVQLCKNKIPVSYPLGEVHHGLVWTTALNYLRPLLPGIVAKGKKNYNGTWQEPMLKVCEDLQKSYDRQPIVFPKLIVMTEAHCRDAGGTLMHVTMAFSKGAPVSDSNFCSSVKAKVAQFLQMKEDTIDNRLEIVPIPSKDQKTPDKVKLTIYRSLPSETYDSSLEKLANGLADHISKYGLEIIPGIVADSADVSGKTFDEFEGIAVGEIRTQDAEDFTIVTKKKTFGIFKVDYGNKSFLASFEFIRAVTSLGQVRDANLAPLSMAQMMDQCAKFNHLFQTVAHKRIPELNKYCELLTFDADAPENRNGNNELRLNKIIAEFIESKLAETQ